jgi:hypothetical protein
MEIYMKKILCAVLVLLSFTIFAVVPSNRVDSPIIDRSISKIEKIKVERTAVGWWASVEGYDSYGSYRYGYSYGMLTKLDAETVALNAYYNVGGVRSRIYKAISRYSSI